MVKKKLKKKKIICHFIVFLPLKLQSMTHITERNLNKRTIIIIKIIAKQFNDNNKCVHK